MPGPYHLQGQDFPYISQCLIAIPYESYISSSHLELILEREKLYIFSSHLGLIRCLTPIRVSAIIYSQAFLDKHGNTTNVILPHELKHGSCMLSKQALISVTNILQPWALKHNMLFITRVFTNTQCAYLMQPGDTLPTTKIPGKVMATHPEPEQGLHTPSGQWQPEYCLGMDVGRPCKPCTIRTKTGTLRRACPRTEREVLPNCIVLGL